MSTPRTGQKKRRLLGAAAVACEACRKQKMRCVGADNPPCVRCAKVRRNCVVPDSQRSTRGCSQEDIETGDNAPSSFHQLSPLSRFNDSSEVQTDTTELAVHTQRFETGQSNDFQTSLPRWTNDDMTRPSEHVKIINLPSVYMNSPLGTIDAQLNANSVHDHHSQPEILIHASTNGPNSTSSRREIHQHDLLKLLQFFRAKIVQNVLFMAPNDLDDLPGLIHGKIELAHCIAFVTSLFVPGYAPVRASLTTHVLKIVRRNHYVSRRSDEDMWTLLQALGVLYLYASPVDAEETEGTSPYHPELSFRVLKPLVESLAVYASIHRSYEDISKGFALTTPECYNNPALRRYLFWLWLFTSSQQYSLITRTPPTISEDSTIKSAPMLLQSIQEDAFVRKILAQVELYLLWAKAGVQYPNVREWWSSPQSELDVASTKAMLAEFDKILLDWRQKWSLVEHGAISGMSPDRFNNTTVESLFRYTRFHISTYATRALYKAVTESAQVGAPASRLVALSPQLTELFSRSVEAAASWSRFFIDLDPAAIETARYVPAINFTKITFSCVFVIMASEVLAGPDLSLDHHLQSVREAAVCMRELAVDNMAPPKIYADRILQRLQTTNTGRLLNAIRIVPHTTPLERGEQSVEDGLPSASERDNNRFPVPGISLSNNPSDGLERYSNTDLGFGFPDFNVILENDEDDIFNFDKTWVF